jgi:MFS family permease
MPDKFESEEKYIINERPEVSVGEAGGWVKRLGGTFPALKNRNYKLYFYGQLVSLIGTWLQIVAQGWLVLQLTNSAFLIGLVAALATLPTLLFTLFGGVVVDRFPKKHILLFTQSAAMVLAFILGILTSLGHIQIWQIGLISFLLGTVNALDAPARQAFVSEMVTRDQLSSAIALNSGAFNAARVMGPSMAGILIALTGTGGAFIINGISYIAVIAALLAMRIDLYVPDKKIHPIKAIREGLNYSFGHPIIRTLIIFAGVTSIFGWSYTTVIPLIAKNEFHLGAAGLGYLFAASGSGALVAAVVISAFSKKVSAMVFILGGNSIFAVSLIFFSFTTDFYLALLLLFLSGFGLISQASMMNSTIQGMVKSEFRGRVMSIYILMFIGFVPLGNMEIGYLSEKFGTGLAIRIGAIIVFIFGLVIFLYRNNISAAYAEYKKTKMSEP